MNVPLKKRHNYGKLNGSVSSHTEPLAKRLNSSYSNYEDSEYDQQSSNMDDSSMNGPATMGYSTKLCRKKPHQYLRVGDRVPVDNRTVANKSTTASSSSSAAADEDAMNSSASNHNSTAHNNQESTSSSSTSTSSTDDSSDSAASPTTTHRTIHHADSLDLYIDYAPLTEDALMQHNTDFEPMNSKERIQFWNVADEFSEIEDDFDEQRNFSKPIRSERVQKRMYKKPTPVASKSSRKSKKEDKTRKTDDKSTAASKKSKNISANKVTKVSPKLDKTAEEPTTTAENQKPTTNVISNELSSSTVNKATDDSAAVTAAVAVVVDRPSPSMPLKTLTTNTIIERRSADGYPSAIKVRVSYGKESQTRSPNFKLPTTSTVTRMINFGGCANCGQHSQGFDRLNDSLLSNASSGLGEMSTLTPNNREEFYKYLGIDTNPSLEKTTPPLTSPTDPNSPLYNHRRSMRVFIQQKQNEFRSKSPIKSPQSNGIVGNSEMNGSMAKRSTPENGKTRNNNLGDLSSAPLSAANGTGSLISSHIRQRHTYESLAALMPPPSPPLLTPSPAQTYGTIATNGLNPFKPTDIQCDAPNQSTKSGETSVVVQPPARIQKRKVRLPSPMMLTEMFKRYKQCFNQGFVMRQRMRQQMMKKNKKRTSEGPTTTTMNAEQNTNHVEMASGEDGLPTPQTTEPTNSTFSSTPIAIAASNNAIAINSNMKERCNGSPSVPPQNITLSASDSMQWKHDLANRIDKSKFRSPLDPKNGAVHAILTHSTSPNHDDVIVVVQESQISYWYSTAKVLSMFGIARSWTRIGEITRVNRDKEVDSLYQHRLIDIGEQFPVYVEMRANESPPDEFRQCCLTFIYLNVYFVKAGEQNQPKMVLERVNLDTIKGYADSIYYTALRTSPSVLMTWTEHNVNNQTRCGTVKYTLKMPTLDNIDDIFDYSFLQHDINTMLAINDYHVVGCGDRTVSMWDHRNGNLLIDIEIELPTIGQNIGCYTIGDDVPEYMLLVQLMPVDGGKDFNKQLKIMAVQTVSPYNWRTLHTHNIPNGFGKIRSIFNKDDMLTITFTNGSMIFLNIAAPHTIYVRNVEPKKQNAQTNGMNSVKPSSEYATNQLFAQSTGHIIEITNEYVATKSVWEYFIDKNVTQNNVNLT